MLIMSLKGQSTVVGSSFISVEADLAQDFHPVYFIGTLGKVELDLGWLGIVQP